jgi:hypothetical protein
MASDLREAQKTNQTISELCSKRTYPEGGGTSASGDIGDVPDCFPGSRGGRRDMESPVAIARTTTIKPRDTTPAISTSINSGPITTPSRAVWLLPQHIATAGRTASSVSSATLWQHANPKVKLMTTDEN